MIPRRQRGIALLTVLLLVAVMAVLVMGVLDDIRFGLRRANNAQSVAQAQWHALGAEALALAQIERLAASDPGRTTSAGDWNGRAFVFPVESGAISARLSDGTACFNLNSVVEGGADTFMLRPDGITQYVALLQALGFSEHEARTLADSLADWIDSDQQRESLGHEDEAYARGRDGYRTAGTLLAETSELRAIHGYTAEVYARLRPHVCALPTVDLSPVNVNTLREEDAAIVRMLTEGKLDDAQARRVIAARPADGWRDVDKFWTAPGMAVPSSDGLLGQVKLRTRYFRLHAEVEVGPAQVVLSALFEHDGSSPARLLARRWSAEE
ncbi:type II secretion system minor pseudopilin GspK [Luteimonas suaedae]|uniref:type II secretion system minor pseudopilin GspK n=1 Tax=Luteimonas suaedae TaxID=2605430 RepID=UPI001658C56D|nr:type II secretion system minor pseudopilin GspK [Luteimonas suaedae]